MNDFVTDALERRLAARQRAELPSELRTRVLAEVRRALEKSNEQRDFLSYAMPVAAGFLICANLLLGLFPFRSDIDRPRSIDALAKDSSQPFGASERELQEAIFLVRSKTGVTRLPSLRAPELRGLLQQETSSWITP